jgi:geranylgeranyl diphosphate synthase type II
LKQFPLLSFASQSNLFPMFDLRAHLKPRQQEAEDALADAMRGLAASAPPILAEAMAYSLLAPGKRLRPLLTILSCEACGGSVGQALPAGCAVEMIHAYSLIHDDLPAMDDDDLRRGLPTCHVKYGEALAILAGDGLQTLAFETLCRGYAPATAAVMCLELARGSGPAGMVGGQVLDLAAEGRISKHPTPQPPPSLGEGGERGEPGGVSDLEAIHRAKTGALIRSALRLGGYAAGATGESLAHLDKYAEAFGLLFQVTDDLLDVESSEESAGKRVNKDADRGKLTYPGLIGVDASRAKAKELADEAIRAANAFGVRGGPLAGLARSVLGRDR